MKRHKFSCKKKYKILISNDDGIFSQGIFDLVNELKKIGEVVVVAPDKQQSAVGHAITMNYPIRAIPYNFDGNINGFAVDGTPADCVKLAIKYLLSEIPDIIVSGINHGSNTAISVIYSGTVSAATEGTILGIPSIAISLATFGTCDFTYAAKFSREITKLVLKNKLPEGTLLNINIPPISESEIKGVKITRQGKSLWDDTFDIRKDPSNKEYFWLTGNLKILDKDEDVDVDEIAVLNKYISITPIQYDLTDYKMFKKLKKWKIKK